jgi:muramidase (phage lysozyme)
VARISAEEAGGVNVISMLDLVAWSEGTLGLGDDGYNVVVGSRPGHVLTFSNSADHPRIKIVLREGLVSDAAGRSQFMSFTWNDLRTANRYTDFSPLNQDRATIQLFKRRGAYEDIVAGHIKIALAKCSQEWASFPGAGYGQQEQRLGALLHQFVIGGGLISN